jgi:hypothetical protein
MERFMSSYFKHPAPAAKSTGTLFRPPVVAGRVDAGSRSPRRRKAARAALVGLSGLALLLLSVRSAQARR